MRFDGQLLPFFAWNTKQSVSSLGWKRPVILPGTVTRLALAGSLFGSCSDSFVMITDAERHRPAVKPADALGSDRHDADRRIVGDDDIDRRSRFRRLVRRS